MLYCVQPVLTGLLKSYLQRKRKKKISSMKSVCGGKSGFKTAGTVTRSCNRLTCTMLHCVLFPHDGKHEDRFSCLWLRLIAFLPLRVSCECVGCCFFLLLFFLTPPGLSFMGDECGKLEGTNQQRQFDPTVSYFHACRSSGRSRNNLFFGY